MPHERFSSGNAAYGIFGPGSALLLALLGGTSAWSQTRPGVNSTPSQPPSEGQIRIAARPPQSLFKGEEGTQKGEIHFDPATAIVTLKLLVQDPSGYFIPNIQRDNFAVYENGVRQQNATVEVEHAAVSLGVLMEFGGRSVTLNKILADQVSLAGHQLLEVVGPEDKIAVWAYADSVTQLADFSQDHETVKRLFYSLKPPQVSETNLHDTVIPVLKTMGSVSGRRAVILLSSGVDTFSKATIDSVLKACTDANTPIYVIGLASVLRKTARLLGDTSAASRIDWKRAETELRQIAQASGGRAYFPESTLNLSPTYDDIMENLSLRYVITYRSSIQADMNLPRTVRVELVNPKTDGPLQIVDVNGKTIRPKVIAQYSYIPNQASERPAP